MTATPGKTTNVNSATMIMGPTGSGKTALLATLAIWVWLNYRKVTRFYTTDGGGFPDMMQALIQRGIVQGWRLRTRDTGDGSLSFETCLRAAQGWWPESINPSTCETEPNVKLIAPMTEAYAMHCPNDHLIKTVPYQSLLTPQMCPVCKTHTTKANMKVAKTTVRTPGFEHVGAVMYDGITSMLSWMLQDMSQRAGRMELKGEEGSIGGKIISGDLKLGASTRSHVGFAQSRSEELALNALSIPGLVVPPIFTALTLETVDDGGLSVRGPKLAGRAKTDEAPAWFGNCLETAVVKDDKDQRIFRLYCNEFVDAAGVRHLVKHRGAPGSLPDYLEDPPLKQGQERATAFSGFNLGNFFELSAQGLTATLADFDARFPDAPGVPAGLVTVGSGAAPTGEGPAAVAAAAPAGGAPVAPAAATPAPPKAAAPKPRMPAAKPTPAPAAPAAPAPAPAQALTAPAQPVVPTPGPEPAQPAEPEAAPAASAAAEPQNSSAAVPPSAEALVEAAAHEVDATIAAAVAPQASASAAPSAKPGGWARPAAPRPPAAAPRVGGRK